MLCIFPIWLNLREWAAGGALTSRSVTIRDRINDQAVCSTPEQSLPKILNPRISETGADRDLSRNTTSARFPYQLPAFLQWGTSFETLAIDLVICFDGDGYTCIRNLPQ